MAELTMFHMTEFGSLDSSVGFWPFERLPAFLGKFGRFRREGRDGSVFALLLPTVTSGFEPGILGMDQLANHRKKPFHFSGK
jgi:hypothetical protein